MSGSEDLRARRTRRAARLSSPHAAESAVNAADAEFRALFLELVNDFFDRAADDVFDHLPAIDRLKWHLVRRRLMPELLEVLRFEKSGEIKGTPVIRRGRRFYGDYPFRGEPHLAIPDSVFKLDRDELPPSRITSSPSRPGWNNGRYRCGWRSPRPSRYACRASRRR